MLKSLPLLAASVLVPRTRACVLCRAQKVTAPPRPGCGPPPRAAAAAGVAAAVAAAPAYAVADAPGGDAPLIAAARGGGPQPGFGGAVIFLARQRMQARVLVAIMSGMSDIRITAMLLQCCSRCLHLGKGSTRGLSPCAGAVRQVDDLCGATPPLPVQACDCTILTHLCILGHNMHQTCRQPKHAPSLNALLAASHKRI